MRRSFLITALLLFTLLALLSPTLAQDNIAEWTYMKYFNMDNNLENGSTATWPKCRPPAAPTR